MTRKSHIAQCLEPGLMAHGGIEVLVREIIHGTKSTADTFLVSTGTMPEEFLPQFPSIKDSFLWSLTANQKSESQRLVAWLKERQVDLAHFHFGTYGWNARSWTGCPIPHVSKSGIPCVATNHGAFTIFDCVAPYRPLWWKVASLPPFWLGKMHQLFHVRWEATVSLNDLASVQRWFFPFKAKFFQLYHSKLSSAEPLRELEKQPRILCLGTIGERKGQPDLVEAFLRIAERFPEWTLVLAGRHGHEPTVARLEFLLRENQALSSRIKILPDVSDAEAATLLATSAVFAMPSTAEGLGLSLQEAQLQQAACVGTRVGGIPELIEDHVTGLLVPPRNPKLLGEALARLLADSILREKFGKAGRQSILDRKMTAEGMCATYLRRYREIISPVQEDAK